MQALPKEPHPNIRLRNVLSIYKSFVERMVAMGEPPMGLESAFARHIEISASLWSQIKAGRSIGDALARQIESKGGKPSTWLDQMHPETAPDPAEEQFILLCRQAWRSGNRRIRAELKKMVVSVAKP